MVNGFSNASDDVSHISSISSRWILYCLKSTLLMSTCFFLTGVMTFRQIFTTEVWDSNLPKMFYCLLITLQCQYSISVMFIKHCSVSWEWHLVAEKETQFLHVILSTWSCFFIVRKYLKPKSQFFVSVSYLLSAQEQI